MTHPEPKTTTTHLLGRQSKAKATLSFNGHDILSNSLPNLGRDTKLPLICKVPLCKKLFSIKRPSHMAAMASWHFILTFFL